MMSESLSAIANSPSTVVENQFRQARRKSVFKIALIFVGALVFIALDLVLGLSIDFQKQKSFRAAHPYYHHCLRPRRQRMTTWGPEPYEMATNSLGCRDQYVREVPLEANGQRVVVIGDSMIEGLGVEYDQTVAGLLQSRWSEHGVEVLNAGVVSFSPRLYKLRTRYLIEEENLNFDRLIVFIDISDIQDELFYESFDPVFERAQPKSRRSWWRRNSLSANVLEKLASHDQRVNNTFRTDAEINVWMEATEAYLESDRNPELGRFEWTVNDEIYQAWGQKGLALARNHMRELSQLCHKHNIEMSVVVYPSPVQIFAFDLDSRQVRFWKEFCEETGDRFINLFPTFIDRSRFSGPEDVYERFFISGDVHWSPTGHQLVAEQIVEDLDGLDADNSDRR